MFHAFVIKVNGFLKDKLTSISGYTKPSESTSCSRQDLSEVNMFEAAHKPPATFPMGIESHGGEDVGLWATGTPSQHQYHHSSVVISISNTRKAALCDHG